MHRPGGVLAHWRRDGCGQPGPGTINAARPSTGEQLLRQIRPFAGDAVAVTAMTISYAARTHCMRRCIYYYIILYTRGKLIRCCNRVACYILSRPCVYETYARETQHVGKRGIRTKTKNENKYYVLLRGRIRFGYFLANAITTTATATAAAATGRAAARNRRPMRKAGNRTLSSRRVVVVGAAVSPCMCGRGGRQGRAVR